MVRRHRIWLSPRARACGFTLYELMITLAIIGILATGAVAAGDFLQRNGITAQINTLFTDMSLARSEAIKRSERVVICKGTGSAACATTAAWNNGWTVFVDLDADDTLDAAEPVLRAQPPAPAQPVMYAPSGNTNKTFLRYKADGFAWPSGRFVVCSADRAYAKAIIVWHTGRARVAVEETDGTPVRCPATPTT